MTDAYLVLAFSILLGVVGQLLLKSGAGTPSVSLIGQILAPHSMIGLGVYFVSALCYMYSLRKLPVSVAFPAVSLSYVIVALLAWRLYDEPLGWSKLAGIVLICSGVALINRQLS